jgi:choline dehydrogenase-like flavoprotein
MIIDARRHDAATVEATVCIVGGGIAGIVTGLELARSGIPCVVLEAGGARHSRRSQVFYRGEVDDPRYSLTGTRTRCLGGSSRCWGGWTRPLNASDFGGRGAFPELAWPFGAETLTEYHDRASAFLQVASPVPDPELVPAVEAAGMAVHAPADSGPLRTVFFNMSPPTRFGTVYWREIDGNPNLTVLLNAPAVEILTDDSGAVVTGVRARTPRGDLVARARFVVLASGGIENPRLLLASNDVHAAGIGNARDLVGRYFMDHPRLRVGDVRLTTPDTFSRLYDSRHYGGGSLLVKRGRVGAALSPSDEEQARAGILSSYTGLLACYMGLTDAATRDATQVMKAVVGQVHERIDPATVLRALRSMHAVVGSFAARKIGLRSMVNRYEFETVLEPWPDRDNRVTLTGERDSLGLPKVHVRWRRGEIERRSHRHAIELVARHIEARGLGTVHVDPSVWEDGWDERVMTTWHHMGTTRMAADASRGVVDPDGRVFGVENLYVTGSSVFPSGGGSPPTYTIAALALRLSEHLRAAVERPSARARLSVVTAESAAAPRAGVG